MGTALQHKLNKIVTLQKTSIRNVLKLPYNTPSLPLFKELRIATFSDLVNIELNKLMYFFTHGLLPASLKSIFTTNVDVHSYATRQNRDPHVIARSTSSASRTFIHRAPKNWLDLPHDVRSSFSQHIFKSRLKSHILQSY